MAKLQSLGDLARPKPAAAPGPEPGRPGCVCQRPLRCRPAPPAPPIPSPPLPRLIMCSRCGETFPGRLRASCPAHPRALFLQDVSACRGCRQADRLLEFDLPAGMEQGLKEFKKS